MQWGDPIWLHALWGLIPLAWLWHWLGRRREQQLATMIDTGVLDKQLPARRRTVQRWRMICLLLAVALGIVALARPQWGEKWIEVQHMGLDILVVLDTSNSMRAEDIRPNRLDRAKLGIRDLVSQLRGDRIGLIPFAGDSYLYCPLTSDYAAFLMMLDDVHPGIIPRGGTAIEQALRRAVRSFDDDMLADRVILLITDGEDHEGNALNVVPEMQSRNIRLFAVGVGTPEGSLIPMVDERGNITYLRDRQGNIVQTRLEEDLLERLATRTGGMYVRATPGDFGLDYIYEYGIAPLQRDMLDTEHLQVYEERYGWFLAVALLLLLVESLLSFRLHPMRWPRWPAWVGMAMLLSWPSMAHADDPHRWMREGRRLYEAEDFATAVEAFQQAGEAARERGMDPAPALHNQANALFRAGALDEAIQVYEEARRTTDTRIQQRVLQNEGLAALTRAQGLLEQEALPEALDSAKHASERFREALTLAPDERRTKLSFELADRLRRHIEEIMPPPPPDQQPADEQEDSDDEGDDEQPQPQPEPEGEEDPEPDAPEPDEQPAPMQPTPEDSHAEPDPRTDSMDEMSEEEAMMILDAMRDEEQQTRDQMRIQLGEPTEVEKDW